MFNYTLCDNDGIPVLDIIAENEEEAWEQVKHCGIRNLSKTMQMVMNV